MTLLALSAPNSVEVNAPMSIPRATNLGRRQGSHRRRVQCRHLIVGQGGDRAGGNGGDLRRPELTDEPGRVRAHPDDTGGDLNPAT